MLTFWLLIIYSEIAFFFKCIQLGYKWAMKCQSAASSYSWRGSDPRSASFNVQKCPPTKPLWRMWSMYAYIKKKSSLLISTLNLVTLLELCRRTAGRDPGGPRLGHLHGRPKSSGRRQLRHRRTGLTRWTHRPMFDYGDFAHRARISFYNHSLRTFKYIQYNQSVTKYIQTYAHANQHTHTNTHIYVTIYNTPKGLYTYCGKVSWRSARLEFP